MTSSCVSIGYWNLLMFVPADFFEKWFSKPVKVRPHRNKLIFVLLEKLVKKVPHIPIMVHSVQIEAH